jgi:hypothetical protein
MRTGLEFLAQRLEQLFNRQPLVLRLPGVAFQPRQIKQTGEQIAQRGD